jgi:hypothetical protein
MEGNIRKYGKLAMVNRSQGVGHNAEVCVALGWNIAIVNNGPLRASGSALFYLCLPPLFRSLIFMESYMATNSKIPLLQDIQEASPPWRFLQEILQQGAGSSSSSCWSAKATG